MTAPWRGARSAATHEDAVRELAAAYGVAIDYWDWQGRHVLVAIDTMVAVLAALGVDASTDGGGPRPRWPRDTTRPGGGCCRRCW